MGAPHGPWGRNECVTNEPQRTSAGRLYSLEIENEKPSFEQGGLKTKTEDQTTAASKSP